MRAPGAPTNTTGGDPDMDIRSTDVSWDGHDASGTDLDVELLVRNAGPAASLTQVAYHVTLDGTPLASGEQDPSTALPAGLVASVHFTIRLPEDFAARWQDANQDDGAAALGLEGTITVRTTAADQRLAYEWSSEGAPKLAETLSAAAPDCPGPPAPLCLKDLDAASQGDKVQATVQLRNDQGEPIVVRNGTFRLVFEDVTVANGRMDGDLEIAPGGDATLPVLLAFDDHALILWWGDHVARCETSRLALGIALEVETVGSSPSIASWDVLAAPLETALVCDGGSR